MKELDCVAESAASLVRVRTASNMLNTREVEGCDGATSETAEALQPSFQCHEMDEKKDTILELTSRLRQRVDDKNRAQDEWERLSYRLNTKTPVRNGGV